MVHKADEGDFGYCSFHDRPVSENTFSWKGCWGCYHFSEGEGFPYRSVVQAASQLNKSETTIRQWIKERKLDGTLFKQGRFTGSLPSPRKYYIRKESVDGLIGKKSKH